MVKQKPVTLTLQRTSDGGVLSSKCYVYITPPIFKKTTADGLERICPKDWQMFSQSIYSGCGIRIALMKFNLAVFFDTRQKLVHKFNYG